MKSQKCPIPAGTILNIPYTITTPNGLPDKYTIEVWIDILGLKFQGCAEATFG